MRFGLSIIVSLVLLSLAAHSSAQSIQRHVEDATLRSVYFIDNKEGWVCGDEGVILHTVDAGRTWERQPTGVRASLRSVHFLTPAVGWAVGRDELPYGMGSVGVVLYTNNGGLEWKQRLANSLPGLNQVRFVSRTTGFLLGDGSEQFPSGVFRTDDGGSKWWDPVAGPRTTTWLGGDFYLSKNGILVGGASRLATVRDLRTTLADQTSWFDGRDVTSVQILEKKAIAVGQGGLVISSVKGGASWSVPQKILAPEVQSSIDFNCIYAVKDSVWAVGRPGSVVAHSSDAGASWRLLKTGQSMPLQAVYFFDEKLGWAVGDAGTILQTSDGGKSWKAQHQGGKRAAVLAIHTLNKNTPVDTLASLGANDGYLAASLRITAPDGNTVAFDRSLDSRRYAAAARLAGGMTGETLWHFPMPQHLEGCDKKTILAHWNLLHANQAEEELIRQLVLALRTWRPSVVITEHPESGIALSSLLGEAVQEAVRRAGDPKAFPEQMSDLDLEAWNVRKVVGQDTRASATVTEDNDHPKERLKGSVREFAATGHALLVDQFMSLPKQRGYRGSGVEPLEWLRTFEQKLPPARRDVRPAEQPDAKLMQLLRERRSVIERADNLDNPPLTLKLVTAGLNKLPDEHAAAAAFTIAGRYAERGQWYFAQEMYLYLVDRFPIHPLSTEAHRFLVRLNTSGEARRRHELNQFAIADPIHLDNKKGPAMIEEKVIKVGHVVPPSSMAVLSQTNVRDWNKGTLELSKRLANFGAIYDFDPRTQLCVNSAKRRLGEIGPSNDGLKRLTKLIGSGPWHEAAHSELWLTDRTLERPIRLAHARSTEVRPFLDGKLDDPCWKDTKPMILSNAVGDTAKAHPTEARFAFDQEFLYIALTCRHPAGQRVAPVKPRQRDADLDAFDRVSILLDVDRDYSTCYHLEVDQRGCVRDSCWGDRSWNPRWFVAVHSTDDAWQIEAAIPLGELSSERIGQQTAWAFNVVRVMPGRGVQGWSLPADVRPRLEGMSLLMFQTAGNRPMMQPVP